VCCLVLCVGGIRLTSSVFFSFGSRFLCFVACILHSENTSGNFMGSMCLSVAYVGNSSENSVISMSVH